MDRRELKRGQAIEAYIGTKKGYRQVCREHGVHRNTLFKWIRKYYRGPGRSGIIITKAWKEEF